MQSRNLLIHMNKWICLLTHCLSCVYLGSLELREKKRSRLKPESENTLYIFAMLRMFPELYIPTKKVLAEDFGVKPKNITRIKPRQDADYSQAVLQAAANWQVQLLADKAINSVIPVPALLKPASNPLKVLKRPSYEPEKLQSSSGTCYFTTLWYDFFFLFSQMDFRPSVLGYSNISCFIFLGHASKIKTSTIMIFSTQGRSEFRRRQGEFKCSV